MTAVNPSVESQEAQRQQLAANFPLSYTLLDGAASPQLLQRIADHPAQCEAYLDELKDKSLDRIKLETETIRISESNIVQRRKALAFDHFDAIVAQGVCIGTMGEGVTSLGDCTDTMLHKLSLLEENVTDASSSMSATLDMLHKWSDARNLLPLLLELCEVPQLMSVCIRGGDYEEAIQLADHAHRLQRRHSASPVMETIIAEVRQQQTVLIHALWHSLTENVSLPSMLNTIALLRRCNVTSDSATLAMGWLAARRQFCLTQCGQLTSTGRWMMRNSDSAKERDSDYGNQHQKEKEKEKDKEKGSTSHMEVLRSLAVEVVAHYRAIFGVDQSCASDPLIPWMQDIVHLYLKLTEDACRQVELGPNLGAIVVTALGCAASFRSLGAGFLPLLQPLLLSHVMGKCAAVMERWQESFALALHATDGWLSMLPSVETQPNGKEGENAQEKEKQKAKEGGLNLNPPPIILHYPPLAVVVNDHLRLINDMRWHVLVGIPECLVEAVRQSWIAIAERIILHAEDGFHSEAAALLETWQGVVLPYLALVWRQLCASAIPLREENGNGNAHGNGLQEQESMLSPAVQAALSIHDLQHAAKLRLQQQQLYHHP
jgi:hypothetical protein